MPSDPAGPTVPPASSNRQWELLLRFIEAGQVVPVVGQELLTVQISGCEVQLYSYLAERLAEKLGVESHPGDSLNTVACRFKDAGNDLNDVYPLLETVLKAAPIAPPEPLLKLADISDTQSSRGFKLFVSMTFDSLLETALNQRRYGGKARADQYAPNIEGRKDLPCEVKNLALPTVYHLLGVAKETPTYAVTDEDTLEFIHSLQSKDARPGLLFDALREMQLLVIGCGFPDWLARFFIRIARDARLISVSKKSWLADERVQGDTDFQFFLQHFGKIEIFPGTARSFVDELHSRWIKAHPPETIQPPPPRPPGVHGLDMIPGSVFVSYASEDREKVEAITLALDQAGIDAWFDRQRLEMGDAWNAKIKENIDDCALFIAIISHHTLTPEGRFFRTEWTRASEQQEARLMNKPFIVPVAIDDTTLEEGDLKVRFGPRQWERLPDGRVTPEFVQKVVRMVREVRRES